MEPTDPTPPQSDSSAAVPNPWLYDERLASAERAVWCTTPWHAARGKRGSGRRRDVPQGPSRERAAQQPMCAVLHGAAVPTTCRLQRQIGRREGVSWQPQHARRGQGARRKGTRCMLASTRRARLVLPRRTPRLAPSCAPDWMTQRTDGRMTLYRCCWLSEHCTAHLGCCGTRARPRLVRAVTLRPRVGAPVPGRCLAALPSFTLPPRFASRACCLPRDLTIPPISRPSTPLHRYPALRCPPAPPPLQRAPLRRRRLLPRPPHSRAPRSSPPPRSSRCASRPLHAPRATARCGALRLRLNVRSRRPLSPLCAPTIRAPPSHHTAQLTSPWLGAVAERPRTARRSRQPAQSHAPAP
jgi:hypothetical protein